jgi:hypothetical protein
MPALAGFSDNAFETHQDFQNAALALLRALKPYQSPSGARIKLPLATGTHFDDVAAQLEGFARALWAVGTLLHSNVVTHDHELIRPYINGLANGTDPEHSDYWGPVVLRDQRFVYIFERLCEIPLTPEQDGGNGDYLLCFAGRTTCHVPLTDLRSKTQHYSVVGDHQWQRLSSD